MRRGWLEAVLILVIVAFAISGCANKWLTSGKIAMNAKNYDKAIEDFQKALQDNPENGEAHYYLAVCYKEKEDYENMLTHLEKAEELYPKKLEEYEKLRQDTWTSLFEAGKKRAEEQEWEDARREFFLATRLLPGRQEAFSNLGFVWQHISDNDSAYFYYSKAYEISPEDMQVLENYASLCFNIGKYDRAEEMYTKLLGKDPQNSGAMEMLGVIYREKNELDKAINYYSRALEIEADNCDLWFNLGILYFRGLQDTVNTNPAYSDSAVGAFSRAYEFCPDDSNTVANLAVAYFTAKKYDEALEILGTFVENHPEVCKGWDLYSRALLLKGMKSDALEAYKKYEDCSGE